MIRRIRLFYMAILLLLSVSVFPGERILEFSYMIGTIAYTTSYESYISEMYSSIPVLNPEIKAALQVSGPYFMGLSFAYWNNNAHDSMDLQCFDCDGWNVADRLWGMFLSRRCGGGRFGLSPFIGVSFHHIDMNLFEWGWLRPPRDYIHRDLTCVDAGLRVFLKIRGSVFLNAEAQNSDSIRDKNYDFEFVKLGFSFIR